MKTMGVVILPSTMHKLSAASDLNGLSWQVLDASKCGVPQKRKRFFMIGKLNEQDDFMTPFLQKGLSKTSMTLREYFGDSLGLNFYYRHPRSYARRGIFSIDEPSPTIRGINRPMPKGYQIHANDPVDSKEGIRALTTSVRDKENRIRIW